MDKWRNVLYGISIGIDEGDKSGRILLNGKDYPWYFFVGGVLVLSGVEPTLNRSKRAVRELFELVDE